MGEVLVLGKQKMEDAPLLLDTCAAIWLADNQRVSEGTLKAVQRAGEVGESIYVSPITAWELGLLVSLERLILFMPPVRWFDRLMLAPGLRLAGMPPELLIASSFLPGSPPRDPADRIVAATAREYGYRLVTRDRPLLDYASQGHIQALAC
jgi:PIN domain nuclease of toxin-antitoxin system